jgi:catechol 2,3-dioxygenase-like lactoylglutathione lyase family enzyme
MTMKLDHATIVAQDYEAVRRFFVDIAGMSVGPRPPFGVDGYWLYLDDAPVVHLIAANPALAAPSGGSPASRIDHIALRVGALAEWQALLGRLEENAIDYAEADVPLSGEKQVFVRIAPGVVVEFVTAVFK